MQLGICSSMKQGICTSRSLKYAWTKKINAIKQYSIEVLFYSYVFSLNIKLLRKNQLIFTLLKNL